ncbi:DUF3392 domain-containing protein [Thalassotalea piscium]
MTDWILALGQEFRHYQYQSSLAIIATLLVIFGNDINNVVRRLVSKQHFIVRSLVFVLVCAFGYGLLTVYLTSVLNQQLNKIPSLYIAPTIIGIFLALGMYAQKQRHI